MEINTIVKEKDTLEIEIVGADETLLAPLVNLLLADDAVAEARYTISHMHRDIPRLLVRMREGKPQTAIKRAVKAMSSQCEAAKKTFDKALK